MRSFTTEEAATDDSSQTPGMLESLRAYLSSRLRQKNLNQQAESLTWMLKALKLSTEAYLEIPVQHVAITNPTYLRKSAVYKDAIRSASSALSLKLLRPSFLAAEAAAEAYGIAGKCDLWLEESDASMPVEASDRTFVAVDYSRAGLTAFLMDEDCATYDILRDFHDLALGSDCINDTKHADMKKALDRIMKPPYDDCFHQPGQLSDVILLGESADDEVLHSVLEDLLGNNLTRYGFGSGTDAETVSPLFAPSRGAAQRCLNWKTPDSFTLFMMGCSGERDNWLYGIWRQPPEHCKEYL